LSAEAPGPRKRFLVSVPIHHRALICVRLDTPGRRGVRSQHGLRRDIESLAVGESPARLLTGNMDKITPFLWFNDQAEEAAAFYTSLFKNSRILEISHYGQEGEAVVGRPKGSVMTVRFELEGREFIALNGGPHFQFTEAISFVVHCDSQAELDHYWEALSAGGSVQQCGWLKDRFGLSWQVVPRLLQELIAGPDAARTQRVMNAMLQMVKFDMAALQRAADGP